MSETLDVAVLQLTSDDDVSTNVAQVLSLLKGLEGKAPDLICLPENALYFRIQEGSKIPSLALDDSRLTPLKDWARVFKSSIHIGSIPRDGGGGKLFNSSVLIGPDGVAEDLYRKIHLFDVDVLGHKPVRESDVFARGEGPATIELQGWKLGLSICYDLRFAELYSAYARAAVDVILIPSAFLVPTSSKLTNWAVQQARVYNVEPMQSTWPDDCQARQVAEDLTLSCAGRRVANEWCPQPGPDLRLKLLPSP